MKRLFGTLFLTLGIASVFTWWIQPSRQSDKPILYWVTGFSPNREQQVEGFTQWLAKEGHDPIDLRIDTSNNDPSKKLIQGVSGVGGDLFDNYGDQISLMQAVGVLADITEPARKYGFGPASTFPSIRDNILIDGRQWGYPTNVSVALFLVNVEAFEAAGMPPPPEKWDVETFEEWGHQYVEARRESGERQRHFFVNAVDRFVLLRSLGMSMYNETMTRCLLDHPHYIRVLEKIYQWTYEDHLLPTSEEESTFAVEGNAGMGVRIAVFARGNYAMLNLGRFAMVRLRNYERQPYAAVYPPHFDYLNVRLAGGSTGLYVKSEKKEEAYRFFQYLASDAYSELIVKTGDGLPLNPAFLDSEEFLTPPDYPNEWGVHEVYAEAIRNYSISRARSPFILQQVANRIETNNYQSFMAGRITGEQAARQSAERINERMENSLKERPDLRKEYQRRLELQRKIELRKAEGRPIPAAWISNPFHKKYYRDLGLLDETVEPGI